MLRLTKKLICKLIKMLRNRYTQISFDDNNVLTFGNYAQVLI